MLSACGSASSPPRSKTTGRQLLPRLRPSWRGLFLSHQLGDVVVGHDEHQHYKKREAGKGQRGNELGRNGAAHTALDNNDKQAPAVEPRYGDDVYNGEVD